MTTATTRADGPTRLVRAEFPIGGLLIGALVFLGIGLPGLVLQPSIRTATVCAVLCMPILVIVWLAFRRAEFIRDTDADVLRVVRHRPPFAAMNREIPRRSIAEVRIGHNQRQRSVVLVLVSGEEVWLPGQSSKALPVEDVAAWVRDWQ